jgi:hypothetical protein
MPNGTKRRLPPPRGTSRPPAHVTKAKVRRRFLGLRLGRYYVGICTRTQRPAVLTSDKGTYCAYHRWQRRRELRTSRHADD